MSGTTELPDGSDQPRFARMQQALVTLGIQAPEQIALFTILSAILHLGNIAFELTTNDQSRVSNRPVLDLTGKLLQIESKKLETSLCFKSFAASKRASVYSKVLSPKEAQYQRDAMAKALYAKIFGWIIKKMNDALNVAASPYSIGKYPTCNP
jgi:myosin heavy subunit